VRGDANVARTLTEVRAFCGRFASLPFDDDAADEYGKLRAHLASSGQMIGPNDLMIASIALARGLILVTHNVREFARVPGLVVEDWQAGP
jgi:tRNA(fMet)-specific endonuclease VapC